MESIPIKEKDKKNNEEKLLIQHTHSFFRRSSCINLRRYKEFYRGKNEIKENNIDIKTLKLP